MPSELNELEKIGLAFVAGLTAAEALVSASNEVDEEESKKSKEDVKVVTGVLKGEEAEMFKKFIKKMGVE